MKLIVRHGIKGDPGCREVAIRSVLALSRRPEHANERIPFKRETARQLFHAVTALEMMCYPVMAFRRPDPLKGYLSPKREPWGIERIEKVIGAALEELHEAAKVDHARYHSEKRARADDGSASLLAARISKRLDVLGMVMGFLTHLEFICCVYRDPESQTRPSWDGPLVA